MRRVEGLGVPCGREEVMQGGGIFAWKCKQWMDVEFLFFFSCNPSASPHSYAHTLLTHPEGGELKASSSQGLCQGRSRPN